jgi:hypothetical protein
MVRPHCTARKSTRRQATGQLVPMDVPPPSEPQPNSPQYVPQGEDSFEIVVTVPAGEDTQEAQQLPQNDDHDNYHEEEEREEGNKAEGEDDEDYTPLSDAIRMRHSATPTRSRPLEMKPPSPPVG